MRLYDGTSDLDFVYGGLTPASVMRRQAMYRMLFEAPCVLYDTTDGRVVSFEPLSDLAVRMAVPQTTSEATFAACEQAMSGAYKAPGVAEAQTTADEAKSTADTAAASVNEYMDALLGLDATDETEATDAE